MGCMHSWMWGETYPDFMDAMMPLACLPVQIAGRNRMMRKMAIDAIRQDPVWESGEYKTPPPAKDTVSASVADCCPRVFGLTSAGSNCRAAICCAVGSNADSTGNPN